MASVSDLPDEIIAEILRQTFTADLSIFNLQSVCKKWNALIQSGQALPKNSAIRICLKTSSQNDKVLDFHIVDKNLETLRKYPVLQTDKLIHKLVPNNRHLLNIYFTIDQSFDSDVLNELVLRLATGKSNQSYISKMHLEGDICQGQSTLSEDTLATLLRQHASTLRSIRGAWIAHTNFLCVKRMLAECPTLHELDFNMKFFDHYANPAKYAEKMNCLSELLLKQKLNLRHVHIMFLCMSVPERVECNLKVLESLPEKSADFNKTETCFTHVSISSRQFESCFHGNSQTMNDRLATSMTNIDRLDIMLSYRDEWIDDPTMFERIDDVDETLRQIIINQNRLNEFTNRQIRTICKQALNLKQLRLQFKSLGEFCFDVSVTIVDLCNIIHQNKNGILDCTFEFPISDEFDVRKTVDTLQKVATSLSVSLKPTEDREATVQISLHPSRSQQSPTITYFHLNIENEIPNGHKLDVIKFLKEEIDFLF